MKNSGHAILTATKALLGATSDTGTPFDVFTKGTLMGDNWARTLVVTKSNPKMPRGKKMTRRQRKAGNK